MSVYDLARETCGEVVRSMITEQVQKKTYKPFFVVLACGREKGEAGDEGAGGGGKDYEAMLGSAGREASRRQLLLISPSSRLRRRSPEQC